MIDGIDDRPRYRVRLFGIFNIDTADGLPVTPRGRKTRALLGYLILAGGEAVSRELLASLLWSERGEEQARASLRQALYELRLPGEGSSLPVVFDRTSARASGRSIWTDLDQLRNLGGTSDAAALSLVVGDHPRQLLSDLDGVDPGFDEWLAAERVRRGDERRGAVLAVAERALVAGDAAGAHRLAMSLLAADPVDEIATRVAMAASHLSGDRHSVRRAFSRLQIALRRELAAAPAAETIELYRHQMASSMAGYPAPAEPADESHAVPRPVEDAIDKVASRPANEIAVVAGVSSPPPSPATATRMLGWPLALCAATLLIVVAVGAAWSWFDGDGRRVLLVAPLQVAAGDGTARALKEGLSTDLARMIVGNGATLSIIDQESPSGAHADLSVNGNAESSNGILRANIKLVAGDAAILWSHAFSAPVADIDALRQAMASKIADVAVCGLGNYKAARNLDLETMRLFLEVCEQKHGNQDEALKLIKQVVARRPDFAHGWAMLSAATATNADESDIALRRQADAYARRALALDPAESEAYYARAVALPGVANWDRRMAILQAGRAVNPAHSMINSTIAWNLGIVGRLREAIDYARQATDPFSPGQTAYLAEVIGFGGDLAEAADILHLARQRFPANLSIARTEFVLAALAGDPHHASTILTDPGVLDFMPADVLLWQRVVAARADPSSSHVDTAVSAILADLSNPQRRGLGTVEKLVAIGRVGDAFTVADSFGPENSSQEDTDKLFWAMMAPFRADRRFMTLAAREGLVSIWIRTGKWPDFCSDKALPYDCRLEAQKALSGAVPAKQPPNRARGNRAAAKTRAMSS